METAIHCTLWFYLTIFTITNIFYHDCFAQIITTTTDQIAAVGATLTLNCSDVSREGYRLTWEIEWSDGVEKHIVCNKSSDVAIWDHRIQYENIYTTTEQDTHQSCLLTFTGITQADAGLFYCTLTPSGNITLSGQDISSNEAVTNFELSVVQCSVSLFYFDEIITFIDIMNGIEIDFLCNVSGNLQPEISWLDSRNNMISTEQNQGLLNRNFTLSDINENFTCLVKRQSSSLNTGDATVCRATLPQIRISPMINMRPVIVMEGADVMIPCSDMIEISPKYVTGYAWFYNNTPISVNDTMFKIQTNDNLSKSFLEIMNVDDHFNLSSFSCELHTDFGIAAVESIELFVIRQSGPGTPTGGREKTMGWPITIGIVTLSAFSVFILLAVSVKFYRSQELQKSKQDNIELKEIKGNGVVNGHINLAMSETDEDFPDDIELGEQLEMDSVTGRRKSSLFRESFADLWKGSNMNLDNISDTSSVSLPSFAAVSRSRPDLLRDHSEEYKESTLKAHPPLSARVSAPASFTFSDKRTSFDVDQIQATLPENDNEVIDNYDESFKEEVNNVPNDFVTESRPSQVSQASNLSIPSVTISFPDETHQTTLEL